MYSHRKIQSRVESLLSSGAADLTSHLEYSRDYIRSVADHLESLVVKNDKGKVVEFRRALDLREREFIDRERLLCAISYHHWSRNYHYIRDALTLAMVPFSPNTYQQVLTSVQAEMEDQGKPVLVQLLKARQGGGTTDTTSKQQHRIQFIPNTSGLIASSDPDKSWKLSQMITRSLRLQPWYLVPTDLEIYASGETFIEVESQNSTLTIQHGNQEAGIVRGDTVNCYHLSEIPDWGKRGKASTEELIDGSLFGAWHPTPLHFGVMESTADGRHDYWHKRWEENKINYPQNLSVEQPVFLPYYLSPELYPTPAWLVSIPVPKSWRPPEFVLDHARLAQEYVRSNPLLRSVLGADWRMSLEMQWWYYFSYSQADKKDSLNIFLSQYPASDLEAFQSKARSVFSIKLVQQYQNRVPPPVGVFKLTGSHIPQILRPEYHELLSSEEPENLEPGSPIPSLPIGEKLTVSYSTPEESLKWHLWPIKFPGYSAVKDHFNILWIWEYPEDNAEYCISLDPSEGVGRDASVLQVYKRGTPLAPTKQVARFSSNLLSGLELWAVFLLLLEYYSTYSLSKGDYSTPLASPETANDGNAVVAELVKRFWPNIYLRRTFDQRQLDPSTRQRWGWKTDLSTRPILTSWLLKLLRGFYIDLSDPWTIDEMRDFVANESADTRRIRLEHDLNSHDDHLFASAISVVTVHDLDILDSETPNFRAVIESHEKLIRFATYGQADSTTRIRHPEGAPGSRGPGKDLTEDQMDAGMHLHYPTHGEDYRY